MDAARACVAEKKRAAFFKTGAGKISTAICFKGLTMLQSLLSFDEVAIQCHDNPDADALASGFGLYSWLRAAGKKTRLFYGGRAPVGKPNLLEMLRALRIPAEHDPSPASVRGLLVTVDCQYGAGNVAPVAADRVAVIDHHIQEKDLPPLHDLRPYLGSCSTLVWKLLADGGYRPETPLATALYYGLYTDTGGFAEIRHPLDRDMWDGLAPDLPVVRKLMRSNLSLQDLDLAADALAALAYRTECRLALVQAPPCDPNILGFISDLAMQVDTVDMVIAFFQAADGIKFSVRTSTREVTAAELAGALTAGGTGSGGGHGEKAGGYINMTRFRAAHGNADPLEYFAETVNRHLGAYAVIDCGAGGGVDMSGMRQYRKLPVPLGYAPCAELFPGRTTLRVRMLEGDMDIAADSDTYLMIGVTGEVYPIRRDTFAASYTPVEKPFAPLLEYPPVVLDKNSGLRLSLLQAARACVGTGGVIRARRLEAGVKVFTRWNRESYLRGEKGDWLAARGDDPTDAYVITAPLFPVLYEPA